MSSLAPLPSLAITGIGLVSAAGAGARALRESMRRGSSHVGPVGRLKAGGLALASGGAVPDEALGFVGSAPGEGRILRMCARAVDEALQDAGLRPPPAAVAVGLAFGTALGAVEEIEALACADGNGEAGPLEALSRRRALPHQELTARLATRFGLRGPLSTFSMTCASGLGALEQATCDLRFGRAQAMLVGGADTLSRFMQSGFSALRALSPSGQLRLFDPARDGILLGEGAAFVLVEPIEGARRRGARVYGRVAGTRLVSDAAHLTSPEETGVGMARAIGLALEEARTAPEELGAVTVTAAGSPVYDRMQSRAVRAALGPAAERVPVTTWELATGHALASTAVLGLVHAAQTLADGLVLPARGAGEIDPACTLPYVTGSPRPLQGRAVLALTVGFGGQNGATVIARAEEGR